MPVDAHAQSSSAAGPPSGSADPTKATSLSTGSAGAGAEDEAEEGEITEEGEIVEDKPSSSAPSDSAGSKPALSGSLPSNSAAEKTATVQAHDRTVTSKPADQLSTQPSTPAGGGSEAVTSSETIAPQAAAASDSATQVPSSSSQQAPQVDTADTKTEAGSSSAAATAGLPATVDNVDGTEASKTSAVSAPASVLPAPAAFVGTTNADAAAEPDPLHPPTSNTPATIAPSAAEAAASTDTNAAREAAVEPKEEVATATFAVQSQAEATAATQVGGSEDIAKVDAMDEDPASATGASAPQDGGVSTPARPQTSIDGNAALPDARVPQQLEDSEMQDAAKTAVTPPTEPMKETLDSKDPQSDGLDGVQTPAAASETAEPPQLQQEDGSNPVKTDETTASAPEPSGAAQPEEKKEQQPPLDLAVRTPEVAGEALKDVKADEAPAVEEGKGPGGKDAAPQGAEMKVAESKSTAPSVDNKAPESNGSNVGKEVLPATPVTAEEAQKVAAPREDQAAGPLRLAAQSASVGAELSSAPAGVEQTHAQSPAREKTRTPQGRPPRQPSAPSTSVPAQSQRPQQQQQQQAPPVDVMRGLRPPPVDMDQQDRERKSRSHTSRPPASERDRPSGADRHLNRERRKEQENERERLERERERERERIRESERNREMMIARENEEARLIWLSLPGNDHPQYYTDTDSDSCYDGPGGIQTYGTDDEDKDLDPPKPLTMQEHYPPPSESSNVVAGKKRKSPALIDSGSYGHRNSGPIRAQVKRRALADVVSPDYDLAIPPLPLDAQTRGMISIDDYPIVDSSIRGEPENRPLFHHDASFGHYNDDDEDDSVPSSDSDEEASKIANERKRRHGNRVGNRGNKLSRNKGVRWHRRGKLGGWTEARMEKEIGDRVRHRIEALQKDSIRALLAAMPAEDKDMLQQFPALRDGLLPAEAQSNGLATRDARGRLLPSDLSEAARLDAQLGLGPGTAPTLADEPISDASERLTSTLLAPTLLKPAVTARQLLTSHTLRHTFRNPHIGALGKTALDLIESEGVLGRAIGRCWSSMERGGWNVNPEPQVNSADDDMDVEEADVNGMGANGVSGDEEAREVLASLTSNPSLQHLDNLFVTKAGLAVPRLDETGQPIFELDGPATAPDARAGDSSQQSEPRLATTLLPATEQRAVVLAALECLHELAADSREYVERLEEVRSRLATIKRRRAEVWAAVREWAIDKEERGEGEQTFHPGAPPATVVEAGTAASSTDAATAPLSTTTKGENGVSAAATTALDGAVGSKAAKTTTSSTGSKSRKKAKATTTPAASAGSDKSKAAPSPPPPAPAGRSTMTSALAGVSYT